MKIRINGNEENVGFEITLLEILNQKGLDKDKVVVEHNAKIVNRNDLFYVVVKEKDIVEIVSFVGGG